MEDCPFPGLAEFDETNARYFFGREIDIRVLTSHALTRQATLFYGPSGVGKSSVLRAGLELAIRDRYSDALIEYRRDWTDPDAIAAWLAGVDAQLKPGRPAILILDQFEEYFLYNKEESFPERLALLLHQRSDVRLVFSLRDDCLHLVNSWRFHIPDILDDTVVLDYPDDQAVRDAVQRPLQVYNALHGRDEQVDCAPGFVDAILADLRKPADAAHPNRLRADPSPVELPYLQLTLRRLWRGLSQTAGAPRAFTVEGLEASTGVGGVVRSHVQDTLDKITEAQRLTACKIFHYMVTPSGSKIAYDAEDLTKLASKNAPSIGLDTVLLLLETLSQGAIRVLRRVGDRFELYHDSLAKPILEWSSTYSEEIPFGYLVDLFSGLAYSLPKAGDVVGRMFEPPVPTPMSLRSISRAHLAIVGDRQILDLRSKYGTTVNARVLRTGNPDLRLQTGDIIALANTAAMAFVSTEDFIAAGHGYGSDGAQGWALLIDGAMRSVSWCGEEQMFLAFGDRGLHAAAERQAGAFACLARQDGGSGRIMALDETRPLQRIDRGSFLHDLPSIVEVGTWVSLDQLEIPSSTDDGVKRGLFTIDDRPFEIIVNLLR